MQSLSDLPNVSEMCIFFLEVNSVKILAFFITNDFISNIRVKVAYFLAKFKQHSLAKISIFKAISKQHFCL